MRFSAKTAKKVFSPKPKTRFPVKNMFSHQNRKTHIFPPKPHFPVKRKKRIFQQNCTFRPKSHKCMFQPKPQKHVFTLKPQNRKIYFPTKPQNYFFSLKSQIKFSAKIVKCIFPLKPQNYIFFAKIIF